MTWQDRLRKLINNAYEARLQENKMKLRKSGYKIMPLTFDSDLSVSGEHLYRNPERCLIKEFFAIQAKKPVHRRATSCMISCPCSKCSPGRL